jgi:hypothetical protein
MGLQYAVVFNADAWRLFRGGSEMASFSSYDGAARAARRLALALSGSGFSVELLLQAPFGELRSEHFAGRVPAPSKPTMH